MKTSIVFFLFLLSYQISAQQAPRTYRPDPVMDRQFQTITEMPGQPPGLTGSVYLQDEWTEMDFIIRKGQLPVDTLTKIQAKLDLKENSFEINTEKGIKILNGGKIESFRLFSSKTGTNELYVNCYQFTTNDGTKINGYGRVLTDGKLRLLERRFVEIKKADYNVQLDVGSKDDKVIQKSELYVVHEDRIFEADKNTLLHLMKDKSGEVKNFVKVNKIRFTSSGDLTKLMEYYKAL